MKWLLKWNSTIAFFHICTTNNAMQDWLMVIYRLAGRKDLINKTD
jgi:hypothetical protein